MSEWNSTWLRELAQSTSLNSKRSVVWKWKQNEITGNPTTQLREESCRKSASWANQATIDYIRLSMTSTKSSRAHTSRRSSWKPSWTWSRRSTRKGSKSCWMSTKCSSESNSFLTITKRRKKTSQRCSKVSLLTTSSSTTSIDSLYHHSILKIPAVQY